MSQRWTSSGLSFQDRSFLTSNVASMSGQARAIVVEPQRSWSQSVKDRLDKLASLPTGWDGYRAQPVSFSVANFALQVLNRVCTSTAELPQIVPGTRGDLQLEWHTPAGDLEVHVVAPYQVQAWRLLAGATGDGDTANLTTDYTQLGEWIRDIAEQGRAVAAAAA